jgi:hypothetical protein
VTPSPLPRSWRSAVPDLVAFLLGLGVAWALRWRTADLIWSLWLSSFVVGYALIVWSLAEPALELLGLGWAHRDEVRASPAAKDPRQIAALAAIALVGGVFYSRSSPSTSAASTSSTRSSCSRGIRSATVSTR